MFLLSEVFFDNLDHFYLKLRPCALHRGNRYLWGGTSPKVKLAGNRGYARKEDKESLPLGFQRVYDGFKVDVRYLRLLDCMQGESAAWLSVKGIRSRVRFHRLSKGYTRASESLFAIFGFLALGMGSLPFGFL